jgi:hypothetical protein
VTPKVQGHESQALEALLKFYCVSAIVSANNPSGGKDKPGCVGTAKLSMLLDLHIISAKSEHTLD